jgi:hypothetical protein
MRTASGFRPVARGVRCLAACALLLAPGCAGSDERGAHERPATAIATPIATATVPPAAPATWPYTFDRDGYDARLSAATTAAERDAVLGERWDALLRMTAHVDLVSQFGFYQTLGDTQLGLIGKLTRPHRSYDELDEPLVIEGQGVVCVVRGDCRARIEARQSGVVHVRGDLSDTIVVGGHGEVLVAGDITESGRVEGSDITRVIVGGDMRGTLENTGSLSAWVHGSLSGSVLTGTPATMLNVMGDFTGTVGPADRPALLAIEVRGFMAAESVRRILAHGYTEAKLSVGESDTAPGHYPRGALTSLQALSGSWVVHRQRAAGPDGAAGKDAAGGPDARGP